MDPNNTTRFDNSTGQPPEDSRPPAVMPTTETITSTNPNPDVTNNIPSPQIQNIDSATTEGANQVIVGAHTNPPSVQVVSQSSQIKSKRSKAIFIIMPTVLLLAVAGIIGWKLTGNSNNKVRGSNITATSSSATTPYDKCFKDSNDTNLCHYYATALNPKANIPVTVISTDNLGGNQTVQTSETDSSGNSKATEPGLTLIEINGVSYVQTGDSGQWVEQASSNSQADNNPAASANTFGIDGSNGSHATFKAEGTVTCGDLTCYKYEVINCCSVPTTEWFSFDTKTYRLAENYVSNNLTTTDTTYNYGPIPTISVPSPVVSQSTSSGQ